MQAQVRAHPATTKLPSLLPSSTWGAVQSIAVLAAGGSLSPQIIKKSQMKGNTGWWESPVGKGGQKDRIEARGREKLAKINTYENLIRDYTESNKLQ